MDSGTITRDEFNCCCAEILKTSKELTDNFAWLGFQVGFRTMFEYCFCLQRLFHTYSK